MTAAATTARIAMPRLSDSMEEGTIIAWLKAPGEPITAGDALVEIETDKATMIYEAERDGVLGALLVAEGEVAALGAPIAELVVEGVNAGARTSSASVPASAPASAAPAADVPALATARSALPVVGRVSATPVARRTAAELRVALETLVGSGPRGRVVRADVLAAAKAARDPAARASAAAGELGDERVPLTTTQRTIARRMAASRSEIPEFTLTAEIDMTDALALRRQLLEAGHRVSVNDIVVKAAALALREHPRLNASWDGDAIVRRARVNVGVAVTTEHGLLVPVIIDAYGKDLVTIAQETRAASERARAGASTPAELSGGTFTVTNLGMFGVLSFDPVIDLPHAAILAVGAVVKRPMFDDAGSVVPRELMQVNLSSDHRVVYGADGARFVARLRELLEHPLLLMMPPTRAEHPGGPS